MLMEIDTLVFQTVSADIHVLNIWLLGLDQHALSKPKKTTRKAQPGTQASEGRTSRMPHLKQWGVVTVVANHLAQGGINDELTPPGQGPGAHDVSGRVRPVARAATVCGYSAGPT